MTSTLRALREAEAKFEQRVDFTRFIKSVASIASTQTLHEAATKAAEVGLGDRVVDVLEKAVSAGTTTNTTVTFGNLYLAFLEQLRATGVADRLAADAGIVLATVRPGAILINVSAITASSPTEGTAKPVSSITLNSNSFSPSKAAAQIVMTRELIDALTD